MKQHNQFVPELWIGAEPVVEKKSYYYIHSALCGCGLVDCSLFETITQKRAHQVTWITPTKQIMCKEDVSSISYKTTFSLDHGEQHFFVIYSVHMMSMIAANSLLKILEEPPTGYRFILFADDKASVLPTISSRCVIFCESALLSEGGHEIVTIFLCDDPLQLIHFYHIFEKNVTSEYEIPMILNMIVYKYLALCNSPCKEQDIIFKRINLFQKQLQMLPLPGSGKLFWRNLFLQYLFLLKNKY